MTKTKVKKEKMPGVRQDHDLWLEGATPSPGPIKKEIEKILGTRKDIIDSSYLSMVDKRDILDVYDRSITKLLRLIKKEVMRNGNNNK